jgi:UDP-N-acetylglucosamine--N-acetylmuramyl-(pentapeptide) pyrophosphoryl-undecaprenol N-acetylglucosamine transferase
VERRGWPIVEVGTTLGIRRELSAGVLARRLGPLAWSTLAALADARRALDALRPDLVIGTGGRASFPTVLAAALRGIPTLTVPHFDVRRTNRVLAFVADRTCVAREADRGRFPRALRRRLAVTGTPLRPEAFARPAPAEARARLGLDPARPAVGIVGYSRGSPAFSALAGEAVRALLALRPGVQVVVQHGDHGLTGSAGGTGSDARPDVLARPFFDDLPAVFAACDAVASAGGETTLLELCAAGVPSLSVALDDTPIGPHIGVLAGSLERAGATERLPAAETTGAGVAARLGALLDDPARRARMSAAGRAAVAPDAVARIVAVADELLRGRPAWRTGIHPAALPGREG